MLIHVVASGDTVTSIAARYGVDPIRLAADNDVPPDGALAVGQTLVVLFPRTVHAVRQGETLSSIAQSYGVPLTQLYQNNITLRAQSTLTVGQTLVIEYTGEKRGTLAVNAYAEPGIDTAYLQTALPYLTYLTPFTYGISAAGTLVPLDDAALITAAAQYDAQPLMHISSLTEQGTFSNERSSLVFSDAQKRSALIADILQTMRSRGYYGLDVDFEFVPANEREAYVAFLRELRDTLNPLSHPLLAALAPKTSARQRGLLYEGHDYALIGNTVNAVLLMTYEWGYTYGPPMAVAPLPQVRRVLDYALTEIAPEKIFLGIPNYGYDWTLPFEEGVSRAQSISSRRAIELAVQYRASVEYDQTARSPYFYYTDQTNRPHVVWFEDARSIEEKLALAAQSGLQGVGYWNLMRPFSQNWLVLNSLYDIEKI